MSSENVPEIKTKSANYFKDYYSKNRDKILSDVKARNNELVDCPICKTQIRKGNYPYHNKTKLHKYIESQLKTDFL